MASIEDVNPAATVEWNVGRIFLGLATAASGVQQLVTGNFVRLVPPLPAWVPWHSFWAYLAGILLILTGIAILSGYRARAAAVVLGAMILLSLLSLQIPQAATNPLAGFMWTNPCKGLALVGGALLLLGTLPGAMAAGAAKRLVLWGSLFLSGFLVLCGVQHFVYADFVDRLVPAWFPRPRFWTYLTGLALMSGGVGMLIPKTARWAALAAGIMILLWVVLLHIPRALADLHNAGEMSGVFEALAVSGIAFILAAIPPAFRPLK